MKGGEINNSDQRFSCLKLNGLLSKENRFQPCSGPRLDSGLAPASSSELRRQQLAFSVAIPAFTSQSVILSDSKDNLVFNHILAFKLKTLLIPRVLLVEASAAPQDVSLD